MTEDSRHLRGTEAATYMTLINREITLARVLSRSTPLSWLFLAINVIFFIGAWVLGEVVLNQDYGFQTWALSVGQLSFYTGMKLNTQIQDQGKWWRLLSSAFVHMDIAHIMFNGYGLYQISPLVERFYGKSRWLVIYLGSSILSALASMWFSDVPSGGASGALYGLVGVMLVLGYKYREDLPERVSRALTRGMLPWVVFGIGIGFLDFLPMDNAAHIGGLASGIVFALFMQSELVNLARPDTPTPKTYYLMQALAGALTAATMSAAVLWGLEVDRCTASRDDYIACYPEIAAEITTPYETYIQQRDSQ